MLWDLLRILGGGVCLYFGAEWLVGGAAGLARSLRVPQLIIGLTVVAYGTSAPEVVVGIKASLAGSGAIALGNVIGSNIANLGLILGVSCLLKPARVDGALVRRELPVLAISTLAVIGLLANGVVSRAEGVVLMLIAVGYSWLMVRTARSPAHSVAESAAQAAAAHRPGETDSQRPTQGRFKLGLIALGGLGVLVLGGNLFVDGSTGLARAFGVSERIIGLTIVAVGTSLPELATSLIAAWRGHSDIAVGNVVGSNIFNVLLCLGSAVVVAPISVTLGSIAVDLVALVALTGFGVFAMRSARTITRLEGGVLLAGYVAFLVALGLQGS
jgi:cation:H+ antiporter